MKKKLCLVAMLCVLLVFMGIILAACSGVTIAQDPNSGNVTVRPAGPDKTPESNPSEGSTEISPTTPRYAVTLAPNDPAAGTVTGAGEYESGAFVTISATTNAGYRLLGWYKGDILVSNKANYTFEMPAHDVGFTAKYEYTGQYIVTLGTDPVGAVNVSGAGVYTSGSFVTVTASSAAGFELIGWYSGTVQVSDSDSYTFEMPEHDVTLTARFAVVPISHSVALSVDPVGAGVLTGAGARESGSFVSVNATANDGYQFLGWYIGNVLVSNRASYVFEMPDHDVALTARFEAIAPITYNVTLSADPAGAGTFSGAGAYEVGESVTIHAASAEGYSFLGWYDGETKVSYGDILSYIFTMPDHDVTLTARFEAVESTIYTVTAIEVPRGSADIQDSPYYVESGNSVTVEVTPAEGYNFIGWYNKAGELVSESLTYTFTPVADEDLEARFYIYDNNINFWNFGNSFGVTVRHDIAKDAYEQDKYISADSFDAFVFTDDERDYEIVLGDNATVTFRGTYCGTYYEETVMTVADGLVYSPLGRSRWNFDQGDNGLIIVSELDWTDEASLNGEYFEYCFDLTSLDSEKSVYIITDGDLEHATVFYGGTENEETFRFYPNHSYTIGSYDKYVEARFTGIIGGRFYAYRSVPTTDFFDHTFDALMYPNESGNGYLTFQPGDIGVFVFVEELPAPKVVYGSLDINNESGSLPVVVTHRDDHDTVDDMVISAGGAGSLNFYDYEYTFEINGNGTAFFTGVYCGIQYADQPLTVSYGYICSPSYGSSCWQFEDGDYGTLIITHSEDFPPRYTLTLESYPAGSVMMIIGAGSYACGDSASLNLMGFSGTFMGWYEGDTLISSIPGCTYTMPDHDVTLTARFGAPTPKITLVSDPEGAGTLRMEGPVTGSTLMIYATPNEGYTFLGWYIGEELYTTSTSTMVSNLTATTYTARFEAVGSSKQEELTIINNHNDTVVTVRHTEEEKSQEYILDGIVSVGNSQKIELNANYYYYIEVSSLAMATFNGSYEGVSFNNFPLDINEGYVCHPYGGISWNSGDDRKGTITITAIQEATPCTDEGFHCVFDLMALDGNKTIKIGICDESYNVSFVKTLYGQTTDEFLFLSENLYCIGSYDRNFEARFTGIFLGKIYSNKLVEEAGHSGDYHFAGLEFPDDTPHAITGFWVGDYGKFVFADTPEKEIVGNITIVNDANSAVEVSVFYVESKIETDLTSVLCGDSQVVGVASYRRSYRFTISDVAAVKFVGTYDGIYYDTVLLETHDGYVYTPSGESYWDFSQNDEGTLTITNAEDIPPRYNLSLRSSSKEFSIPLLGGGSYACGDSVSLSLMGFSSEFVGWYEGDTLISSNPSCTYIMPDHDVTLTARFEADVQVPYNVNLLVDPEYAGSVIGAGQVLSGELCTIEAIPAEGATFYCWFDGKTYYYENPYSFTMPDDDVTLTAIFKQASGYMFLDLETNNKNGGSVFGGGSYVSGESVTIRAVPNEGYYFLGWFRGDSCCSADAEYTFIAPNEGVKLIAEFFSLEYPKLTIIVDPEEGGIVTGVVGSYPAGTLFGGITARPAEGYSFAGWYKDDVLLSTNTSLWHVMPAYDETLTARFEAKEPSVQSGILYVNNVNGGVDVDITYYDSDNEYRTPILAGNALSYRFSLDASYYVLNVYGPATAFFKGTYHNTYYENKPLMVVGDTIVAPAGHDSWCFWEGNGGVVTITYYDLSNIMSGNTGTFDYTFDLSQVSSEKSITIEQYYYNAPSTIDDTQVLNSWTIDGRTTGTVTFCRGYNYVINGADLMWAKFTGVYAGNFYSNSNLHYTRNDECAFFSTPLGYISGDEYHLWTGFSADEVTFEGIYQGDEFSTTAVPITYSDYYDIADVKDAGVWSFTTGDTGTITIYYTKLKT